MKNCPDHWQSEFDDARKDIAASIKSGEFTMDEWTRAME